MKELLRAKAEWVETELAQLLQTHFADAPAMLREAMQYSLMAGGKRIRAVMVLQGCELAGGQAAQALPFACAIEMIHAYSLIHDDLPAMDNDDLRRGRPTCHKVYGEAMAILAGDGLLNTAYEVMVRAACTQGENALLAMRAIAHGAGIEGMVGGQCLDLAAAGQADGDVMDIHRRKTGALLHAALQAGLYCGNATQQLHRCMDIYAKHYGVLFQITDDLLDATGDAAALGKTPGKDARDEKTTFVSRYGIAGARQHAQWHCEECLAAMQQTSPNGFFSALATKTLTRIQ